MWGWTAGIKKRDKIEGGRRAFIDLVAPTLISWSRISFGPSVAVGSRIMEGILSLDAISQ